MEGLKNERDVETLMRAAYVGIAAKATHVVSKRITCENLIANNLLRSERRRVTIVDGRMEVLI